jgi:dolichol-phosphate mannosyltransferase
MNQVETQTQRVRSIEHAQPAALEVCEVSLIVPTRNEEESIPALVQRLSSVLGHVNYEVILVDDSEDDTPRVALAAAAEYDLTLSVVHRDAEERQGGLSTAVLAGIDAARGGYVCVMDADLQHPPELIGEMLEAAAVGNSDIVIASRYVDGGSDAGLSSRARRLISLASKRLVKSAFRRRLASVTDPLSGFFLARRSLLQETALRPIGFKILLDILVRSDWQSVTELPLQFERRAAGSSKATFKQGRDFLAHVARLTWESSRGEISVRNAGRIPVEPQVTQARS